jgi:hypothetical protein
LDLFLLIRNILMSLFSLGHLPGSGDGSNRECFGLPHSEIEPVADRFCISVIIIVTFADFENSERLLKIMSR